MAGKRQHHVWRLFQTGFTEADGNHTWVYDRSGLASSESISEYGVSDYFYRSYSADADPQITAFENRAQRRVQRWRDLPAGSDVPSKQVAPIIALLESRSLFFRDELTRVTKAGLRRFVDTVAKIAPKRGSLQRALAENPELLVKAAQIFEFDEETARRLAPLGQQLWPALPDTQDSGWLLNGFALLNPIIENAGEHIAAGQISALSRHLESSGRIKFLSGFNYKITHAEKSFILPDTCLATFSNKGRCAPAGLGDQTNRVAVPISKTHAIIGTRGNLPPLPSRSILRALASCSYKNFLSHETSHDLNLLSQRIGRNSTVIREGEINRIVDPCAESFVRQLFGRE